MDIKNKYNVLNESSSRSPYLTAVFGACQEHRVVAHRREGLEVYFARLLPIFHPI